MVTSYLNRRNVIDVQGLIQRSKGSRAKIVHYGLLHVGALPHLASRLEASGHASIESSPILQRLFREQAEAVAALDEAIAADLESDVCDRLQSDLNIRTSRVHETRRLLRLRRITELANEREDDIAVRALMGEGPIASA
ncbi:hypothetical protein PSEUBRA_002588 [Kalmanozyma brasiliensis GHG001]|uniref:Uncharacterized protein n=1 Tax=Kalmanozyma brasiliensis (strain GHG001) TaxID=1365824 RepID=V5EY09_KALBG|nr:uncharacterized protein PSEUBRA_002588 [Kalmanozyma brasiliensis GHG001]EST07509.1 hypothetical protein PSEUBRA_002588 [Kalmanozyma brasiliensis GHG001]